MNVIYVLIPIAIIIVAIALLVFFWAVKANQFDDLERQGSAILFDDDVEDIVTPAPQAAAEPKSPPHQQRPLLHLILLRLTTSPIASSRCSIWIQFI